MYYQITIEAWSFKHPMWLALCFLKKFANIGYESIFNELTLNIEIIIRNH
jgi:hypothetical protein